MMVLTDRIIISCNRGAEQRVRLDQRLRDLHEGLVSRSRHPHSLAGVSRTEPRDSAGGRVPYRTPL